MLWDWPTPEACVLIWNNSGHDSAQMKDFIRGLKAGVKAADDEQQKAYFTGVQIGQQLKGMMDRFNFDLSGNDSVQVVNNDNFLSAFITEAMGGKTLMSLGQRDGLSARQHGPHQG